MELKTEDETWFEFMDRAKRNGVSPTTQEQLDRDYEIKKKLKVKGEVNK